MAIHDGKTLTAPKQLNLSLGPFNITSDGKIWKVEKGTLVQFDPLTTTKRSFGLVKHPQIIGNGHHPLLAVLRTSTTLSLIDWATGNERQVPLNPPFQGGMTQASFSDDQRILLVRSIVPNSNELAKRDSLLSAYNLDNGTLIATRNIGAASLFYPTLIADQWMIEQLDAHSEQSRLLRWNVATNQVIEVVGPVIWSKVRAAWMGEFTGAPINPVSIELQTAVTPRPLEVSYDRSSPLPTIEPPSTQPIVLLSERLGGGETLQRFNTDQSLEVLLEDFRYEFPRYNQPPLLLQRPTSDTWRLVDGATLQTVVWQFEAPINAETYIPIILDPTYQSMVAVVHKDLRKDDQFTEPTQLVQINTQTGAWNVLADSHTWQHLIGSAPIAWYGDTVYFNQWNEGKSIRLWRAQLGPPFQAEKIAEIPAIVANIPDVDSALQAKVYVSPNQRWLLYPLAAANKTMVLRALDVVNQRSHDIALPLMDINELSFSPDGNSFAFMLPTADRAAEYPALYQLEQQRWYQLDLSSNGYKHKLPFLWSPDGHWLLVKLSTKSQETLMAVYDAQQPSQVFRTELAFRTQPLALDNDGKTLLVTHFLQPNLEQRTWNGQAWQSDWRIDSPISNPEAISYLYPR
ncbi:hypothetical protein SE18_00070 [Herpetosiphon geysericola]|uniref:Uncharacterized protein n=1 Tax=Herpetosiphon geysericola TaxID=70996 RepID=A0A0P6YED9_9CHLR|nr:hypothetical protein SE18_00070 [Herpetosiphon geysericola]